ncbi:MAG: TIGR00304 family protein [Nitrososphaeria archaeon]|nr:TIGR00304 family protein [Aigarchaeota archaeon]MCX8187383.1 TIGR00304 family protein [Nitrososphaeria archaeon]
MRGASPEFLFFLGTILIFLGVFVVFLGFLPVNRAEGVGVILIGPFPIIFQGEINPIIFLAIMFILAFIVIVTIIGVMRRFVHFKSEE